MRKLENMMSSYLGKILKLNFITNIRYVEQNFSINKLELKTKIKLIMTMFINNL